MNKKTALAYAIIGVLTNGQSVVAEGLNEKLSFHAVKGAKSTGIQLIPIGPASSSKGDYSLAAGKYADSEGSHSISLGVESHSKGEYSFAAGVKAKSTGIQSIAIGPASSSKGDYSLAAGKYADSQGSHSISLGVESHSKGEYSFAAGVRAESPGKQSIAIGTVSSSKGDYSVAAGKYADSQGSHSISLGVKSHSKGEYSFAAGVSAESPGKQSIAIGSNSQSTGDYSLALGSDSKADRKYDDGQLSAIKAEQDNQLGSEKIREVSLGVLKNKGEGSVFSQITHVAPGTKDTDAVNLYQLKRIKRDLDERIGEVEKIKTTKNNVERFQNEGSSASQLTTQHRDNAKTALTESQTHRDNAKVVLDATVKHRNNANLALVETQGHRDNAKGASEIAKTALMETQTHRDNAYDALKMVKVHENSADSIVKRLKREALLLDGEITQSSDGTMYIGKELEGSQIFVSGKQGDRVIRGVASGVRNSDAVNVSQLNTVRTTANYASQLAQKNSSRINHLEDKLSKTNTKIERGLATSAALTGLFQPYGVGKVNFTASIGGYGASQALAVGTGYRITENAAVKAGVAYSGGNHVMYNASFNFEW